MRQHLTMGPNIKATHISITSTHTKGKYVASITAESTKGKG